MKDKMKVKASTRFPAVIYRLIEAASSLTLMGTVFLWNFIW